VTPRIDLTVAQIALVRETLGDAFQPEDLTWLDFLNEQTNAPALLRMLLERIEGREGDVAALETQIRQRTALRDWYAHQIAAYRRSIARLLEATGCNAMRLPEASFSVRPGRPGVEVTDPEAVPHEYTRSTVRPDLTAIKAAFADSDRLPNWLRRTEPDTSLTIRRS
jgi:hypothetical protein